MTANNNKIFQENLIFTDDEDDFEIGELENFNIDQIAPKQETEDLKIFFDEFSETSLLADDNDDSDDFFEENDLKSIFKLFEN
ncbi:MAG: hypothetical protein II937_13940 [Bacteroidales bacterium]|nr:hypothetical protein [Bacteroidales bacterium]